MVGSAGEFSQVVLKGSVLQVILVGWKPSLFAATSALLGTFGYLVSLFLLGLGTQLGYPAVDLVWLDDWPVLQASSSDKLGYNRPVQSSCPVNWDVGMGASFALASAVTSTVPADRLSFSGLRSMPNTVGRFLGPELFAGGVGLSGLWRAITFAGFALTDALLVFRLSSLIGLRVLSNLDGGMPPVVELAEDDRLDRPLLPWHAYPLVESLGIIKVKGRRKGEAAAGGQSHEP